MYTVYQATNKINGKRYIGVTGKGLPYRRRRHIKLAITGGMECPRLYDAIRKYGVKAFQWKSLAEFSIRELAYHHEMILVDDLKPEYNVVRGGNMGPHENLHNRKEVMCLEDGKVYPSGYAAAAVYGTSQGCISAVCRGKRETASGKHFIFFDGRNRGQQERQKLISEASTACTKRRKRVATIKFDRRPMVDGIDVRGWKWNGPASRSKSVICLDDGRIFESCAAAAQAYGTDVGSMSRTCRGVRRHKSVKGKHFAFIEDVGQRMMA